MRLYHFTSRRNARGIGERGLVPHIGENTYHLMTLGVPVVWLTSDARPTWYAGVPKGVCMITLDVRRSKHLHHWRTWLASAEAEAFDKHGNTFPIVGKEVLATHDTSLGVTFPEGGPFSSNYVADSENYFIYTGTIPRQRIIKCQQVEYARSA